MEQFEQAHPGLFIAGHMRNGISLPDCINAGRTAAEQVMSSGVVRPYHL